MILHESIVYQICFQACDMNSSQSQLFNDLDFMVIFAFNLRFCMEVYIIKTALNLNVWILNNHSFLMMYETRLIVFFLYFLPNVLHISVTCKISSKLLLFKKNMLFHFLYFYFIQSLFTFLYLFIWPIARVFTFLPPVYLTFQQKWCLLSDFKNSSV